MPSYKTFQGNQLVKMFEAEPLPVIKGWNRLEGRPRTKNFDVTLRAEVRGGLWMISRQWQMGEFNADDAGSPVFARVKIDTTRIKRVQLKDHPVQDYDESIPLEALIEREEVPVTLDLSLEIARYWRRLINQAQSAGELTKDYHADFVKAYAIKMPADDSEKQDILPHQSEWQWRAATAERSVDGGRLLRDIINGADLFADFTTPPAPSDASRMNELAQTLLQWWQRQYNMPPSDQTAWAPSHLEYQAAASAPDFDGDDEIVLTADEYHHGHLDWYSFDVDSNRNRLSDETSDGVESMVSDFIPTVIEFGGMPNLRWWEAEDRQTHFGDINADTTDLAKLLLIEFGLIYANDWFLLPFEVPVGTLSKVQGLAVTNVFGERIWIDAVERGKEAGWQSWSMYRLNARGQSRPTQRFVFVPPAVDRLLQGAPVEKVNMIRDEMANLVWGVEQRLQLSSGQVRDGYEVTTELLNYLIAQLPPATDEPQTDASIKYSLMTSVPENWIPFIPVKPPAGDINNREIQLQRAAMLRTLPGAADTPKIRPRGTILGHNFDSTYFVHEEEIPRAAVRVTRSFQRARWHDGKVCVWLGRRKQTGRGEGNSGLAFDQLVPVE